MPATEAKQAERKADIDVRDMMQMMDVVDALRQQQKLVDKELGRDAQTAEIKQRLKATYQQMGTEVGEAALEKAINDYFSNRYAFTPPKRDFRYSVASAYVERGRLGRRYGIPVLIAGMLGSTIWGMVELGKFAVRRSEESDVEETAITLYRQGQKLETKRAALSGFPQLQQMPAAEQTEIETISRRSREEIEKTKAFFAQYCSDGTCEDDITPENYKDALEQIIPVAASLDSVDKALQHGAELQRRHIHLGRIAHTLDSLIADARGAKLEPVFLGAAETAYQKGREKVKMRDLSSAEHESNVLADLVKDGQKYNDLSGQVEQQHQAIKKLAQDPEAQSQARRIYQRAQGYQQARDVPHLEQTATELMLLGIALEQEYEVRIVSKPGVKSGIWRYPHDNPGAKNYYLVVEAIGADGAPISLSITSEEDQITRTVNMFGERVTEAAYEKVKNDKLDDGIIQQNVVGRKQRGYLKPEYDASFSVQGGRITAGW